MNISINIPSARSFSTDRQTQFGKNAIVIAPHANDQKVSERFLSESSTLIGFFNELMPSILSHLDQYFQGKLPDESITSAIDTGNLTINGREFNVKLTNLDIADADDPINKKATNLGVSLQEATTGDYIVLATQGTLDKASLDHMSVVDKQQSGTTTDEAGLVYHTKIPSGVHTAKMYGFETGEQCISTSGTSMNSSWLGAKRYIAQAGK